MRNNKESILLDNVYENEANNDIRSLQVKLDRTNRRFRVALAFAILAVCGLGVFFGMNYFPATTAATSEVVLAHEKDCDTCMTLGDTIDYVICKTCKFDIHEPKSMTCPDGYGDMMITKVKSGMEEIDSGSILSEVYKFCQDNFFDNACSFTWTEDIASEIVESTDENGDPILLSKRKPGFPSLAEDQAKVKYTCTNMNANEPELLLSKPHECDACQSFPDLEDYQTCKSCKFNMYADKELFCPPDLTNIQILDVKRGEKPTKPEKPVFKAEAMEAASKLYEQCKSGWDESKNGCTINWADAMDYVMDEEDLPNDLPLYDENGALLNPNKKLRKRSPEDVKVKFLCSN